MMTMQPCPMAAHLSQCRPHWSISPVEFLSPATNSTCLVRARVAGEWAGLVDMAMVGPATFSSECWHLG